MPGLLKLAPWPVMATYTIVGEVLPNAATVVGFAGIAAIVGGCLVVGYYKAAADKGEKLLALARSETDLIVQKAERLEKENAVLRAQPNLEQHARLLERLIERVEAHDEEMRKIGSKQAIIWDGVIARLDQITVAVVPPE